MKRYSVLPNHDGFIVGLYEAEEGEYVKYEYAKQLEAERNSAFDAIAKLTTERDRYREALELAYDMLINPKHMEYSAMLEAYRKINEIVESEK
jgi:hypothetical protein